MRQNRDFRIFDALFGIKPIQNVLKLESDLYEFILKVFLLNLMLIMFEKRFQLFDCTIVDPPLFLLDRHKCAICEQGKTIDNVLPLLVEQTLFTIQFISEFKFDVNP